MKTSTVFPLALLGAVAVSYLFAWKYPGMNYMAFWLVGIVLLLITRQTAAERRRLLPFAALTLLYAAPTALYRTYLSSVLFWPLWLIGGVSIVFGWKALPVAGIQAIVNFFAAPIMLIRNLILERVGQVGKSIRQLFLYGIALIVFVIFTIVYAGASTSLATTLENLFDFNLPELFGYVFWVGVGYVLMAGALAPFLPQSLQNLDQNLPDDFRPGMESTLSQSFKLPTADEFRPAFVLVIALTLLATYAALGDAYYLFQPEQLPKGVTYSGFVHKSVEIIVVGVVLIAALAGVLFRDEAHHQGAFNRVRTVFYLFLGANLLLVGVGWAKNVAYIEAYNLSFARIWVYVWLVLIAGGLGLTAVKIARMRSFYWLFKSGLWLGVVVLGLACTLPSDHLVRTAHLNRPEKADIDYLLRELGDEERYLTVLEAPDSLLAKSKILERQGGATLAENRRLYLAGIGLRPQASWQSETVEHLWALEEIGEKK